MLILDTHALYWWVNRTPGKLERRQLDAIETAASLAVSAMTCWEMTWLVKHERIALKLPITDWLNQIEKYGVNVIPVTRAIAERAASLVENHKDPVDRIIIATAIELQARLISVDSQFPAYQELAGLLV
ncbi:MAG: type II toxin-antitoxin system VapC family toxin [Pseudomonadales bacterium]|jgi:PIN domain nuclease of toxin-antitoxin system|nr:type II toxin-antitoxin system VapC family toxin [Pseudomonadales bacterium]